MMKKKIFKKSENLYKNIFLAIFLWSFFPIRICNRIYLDPGGMKVYCYWTTVGWKIISDWFYYGSSDTLFFIILLFLSLIIFFIFSFVFISLFNKIRGWIKNLK